METDVGLERPGSELNESRFAIVCPAVMPSPVTLRHPFSDFGLTPHQGYPKPREGYGTTLARMRPDAEGPMSEAQLDTEYRLMQQLLPGEVQDATQLEMGRKVSGYDQDLRGEEARLGPDSVSAQNQHPKRGHAQT